MVRFTDVWAQTLMDVLNEVARNPGSILAREAKELIDLIRGQLNQPNHAEDLISTVARLLMEPRRRLSGDLIDDLRRAILSPMELTRVETKITKLGECADCGRRFVDGEVTGTSSGHSYCYRCMRPDVVVCVDCEEIVDVSGIRKTIDRTLAKHTCSARPAPPDPVVPTPPEPLTATIQYPSNPLPQDWIMLENRAQAQPAVNRAPQAPTVRVPREWPSPFDDSNGQT